jgi:hypothetical protein
MSLILDHAFVGCSPGAPEADALTRLGLVEGPSNQHPGQGTACRRFFFDNAYLELGWIADLAEVQAEPARRTGLYERWSGHEPGACPLGIILRSSEPSLPFPSWHYAPAYLPEDTTIEIARDVPLTQPALFCLVSTAPAPRRSPAHDMPIRQLTTVRVTLPGDGELAGPLRVIRDAGLVQFSRGDGYLLALQFDGGTQGRVEDLRPELPVTLGW